MLNTPIEPVAGAQKPSAPASKPPSQMASALAVVVLGLVAIFAIQSSMDSASLADDDGGHDYASYADQEAYFEEGDCNVMGITLRGDIYTYLPPDDPNFPPLDATSSEDVVAQIRQAEALEGAKGILLEIDSYGGSPVAAEEIAAALRDASKPTVALIRSAGDSAAYWAATGADTIVASPNSDVGSIGVTSSFVDNAEKNKLEGYRYNELSTGKYKDMFSPDRELTPEERDLVLRDLNIILENFIADVATNRELPVEKVRAMADGSTMLGKAALENGLIDALGSHSEAEKRLSDAIGETASVCW